MGTDADGEPMHCCVVVSATGTDEVRRVKLPQGGNQRIVWAALRPMLKDDQRVSALRLDLTPESYGEST